MSERPVTRGDVAARAGVSTAVVSYVINGGPRPVSAETRRRVEEAIAELNYRPNASARALKLSRTDTIGLLVRDNVNPFFAEFAHVVEDIAFDLGYAVLLGNTNGDPARERHYLDVFLDRAVDGLLAIGMSTPPSLEAAGRLNRPVVIVDQVTPAEHIASVTIDDAGGAAAATRHLIGHGHARIDCVGGPHSVSAAEDRVTGWRTALAESGHTGVLHTAPFTREGGYLATRDILGRDDLPTALFVASDIQAVGVLRALAERGLSVPADVAVISFDGTQEAAYACPPLTVVQQPFQRIAQLSLDLLTKGDCTGHHELPVELTIRRSCGCPTPQ